MTNKLFLSAATMVILGMGLVGAAAQSGGSSQEGQPLPLKQQQQPSGTDEPAKIPETGEETTKPKLQQSGEGKTSKGDATGSISPTTEQKTTIREKVDFKRFEVTNVTFNVRVGTAVPRTVVLYDPTPDLIAIVPAWRRYKLIVVSGDILLIDPDTYEIVAVIEG